ncbi:raffinose/stachyose/melibiose transport system permease protein [Lipingzhangella halophila]|uniref:Raffinose/stachyose/melibiose transport system permease protein n=1 Tax=Lipingzhangella halophila TaxID=1783352 RepID=A0A7W7RI14_9ACTN|nr:sugar ABC transporter permease [Lipingzhangella halophila]MBB4932379.1 raffinose/stachyose/melibiose transport system permease protein [Lipingzhangella halophila]
MSNTVADTAPPVRATAPRSGAPRGEKRAPSWRGYLYVLPALAFYVLFAVLPMLHTVYLSFFDWDGVTVASWVGLGNYREVLADPDLRGAVLNALTLVVFFSWLPIVLGMVMVGLLARHPRRGMTAFRLLFFVPQVVPLVAVGITWRWMYGSDGVVNQALRAVGLDTVTRAWLGDADFALIAVGLVGTWAMSGLCMVLFFSGVQKVDPNLYEAARIDGAGPVREFRTVTLPALRGEVAVALTVTTVAALASFDIVYVTTDGGPAGNTNVPGLLVYRLAFTQNEVGLAAAVATVLAAMILFLVFTITRLVKPE